MFFIHIFSKLQKRAMKILKIEDFFYVCSIRLVFEIDIIAPEKSSLLKIDNV